MDIRKVFGANLRRIRLAAKLSQEAVAESMGNDRAYVSGMERGQQNVTIVTAWHAAQALSCRVIDLLNEDTVAGAGLAKKRAPRRPRTKSGR